MSIDAFKEESPKPIDVALPSVSFSASSDRLSELHSNITGSVTLTLDFPSKNSSSVTLESNGTAELNKDFSLSSTTVHFNPGETTKTITVTVLEDALGGELLEEIILNLSAYSGLKPGDTTQAKMEIENLFDLNFMSLFNDGNLFTTRSAPFNMITFTRNSPGTYIDADGIIKSALTNVPRFNHDPLTGQPLGLVMENKTENRLTFSESFDLNWVSTGMLPFTSGSEIDSTQTRSPDNEFGAELFLEDETSSTHSVSRTLSDGGSSAWTFSVFAKANGRDVIQLKMSYLTSSSSLTCPLNSTDALTVSNTGSGNIPTDFQRVEFKNGWFRCSFLAVPAGSGSNLTFSILGINGSDTYMGESSKGFFLWGANATRTLESQPPIISSYVPTLTASNTRREAETAIINDITSFYKNDYVGTIITEVSLIGLTTHGLEQRAFSLDTTSNDRLEQVVRNRFGNSSIVIRATDDLGTNSTSTLNMGSNNQSNIGIPYRTAMSYDLGSIEAVQDGVHLFNGPIIKQPTANKLRIGGVALSGYGLKGNFARFSYAPILSSLSQIQDWTTPGFIFRNTKPQVSLAQTNLTTTESGETSFIIGLDEKSSQTVTVNFTLSGSATNGTDYSAISPTPISFSPGEMRKVVTISPQVDMDIEGSETVILTLSNPINADLVPIISSELIISD